MQQFFIPPVAVASETDHLTNPVWYNAEHHPRTALFSRRVARPGGPAGPGPGNEGHAQPHIWQDVTCAQFRDEVVAVARGLVAAGIAAGDRVALMSRTRYEWTLLDYAIWSVGAVTVPIYDTSRLDQIQWVLSDSGAVAAIVETPAHRADLDRIRSTVSDLHHVWQIEPDPPAGAGAAPSAQTPPAAVAELVRLGAAVPVAEVEYRRATATAADLATIIYTSGTTGRPKGCMLTHRNMFVDAANATIWLADPLLAEAEAAQGYASTLLFLPLAHSFARLIQVGAVLLRVRTSHTADLSHLMDDLAAVRPTFVLAVPRVFEKLYAAARQRAHDSGRGAVFDRAEAVAVAYSQALDTGNGPGLGLRVRHAVFDRLVYRRLRAALGAGCRAAMSGGAPLGVRLAHFFRGAGVTVYEGYGLTETSPAATINQYHHIRIGTVGRPLPGVTIRIADDGEVLVRGDLVFAGYWHDPVATAEVKDPDGWLHTGDLGSLDSDGYLTITGRKKEIIVTAGGKNVAPAVLEDRVRAHPLVSQCMLVGDRQPYVAALVTLDAEAVAAWQARRRGTPAVTSPADGHGPGTHGPRDLTRDPDLLREIQGAVDAANQAAGSRAESIRTFRVVPGDFTEANGMLTPSHKVRRTVVAKEYADEIAAIYR